MRAAAILGLGSSANDLKPFLYDSQTEWMVGPPAASKEADVILIFGGDGTVHCHLARLVKLQVPVLVVPCGSGNDFARALGLRSVRDSLSAWRKFSSGKAKVQAIDLGMVTSLESGITDPRLTQKPRPDHKVQPFDTAEAVPFPFSQEAPEKAPYPVLGTRSYFCCVGGIGLDTEIARRANELPRWLRGHGGYAISLPGALAHFSPPTMTILLPDSRNPDKFATHRCQPTILAAFANAPAYGGGMRIAPKAQMDDGKLDMCLIGDVNRFKLFCLFPTVYFGHHVKIPQVEYFQAERLRLKTETPLDVYADGEYVCRTPVEVGVAPRALTVICR